MIGRRKLQNEGFRTFAVQQTFGRKNQDDTWHTWKENAYTVFLVTLDERDQMQYLGTNGGNTNLDLEETIWKRVGRVNLAQDRNTEVSCHEHSYGIPFTQNVENVSTRRKATRVLRTIRLHGISKR